MESTKVYSSKYKHNNIEYLVELSKESGGITIKITDHNNSDIIPIVYKGKYSLNELKDKNKFFILYESLEELSDFFKQIIEQNKLLISSELSGLKTIWTFIKGIKEDKIELILTKINLEKDDIIQTLISEVKILKSENIKVNEKINELERRIISLENERKEKEEEDQNSNGLINKIIKNSDEAKELSFFLFYNYKNKFKLLYQATRDGDKISDIENKIKGYSPTLFLVYTKKGIKCGGYTKALWAFDGSYKSDELAFLFNFTNKKIFKIKNINEAIICYNNDVACFGNYNHSDYYIRNGFLRNQIYEAKEKYSYYSNDYDVQGENDAKIFELEIYHIF